MKRKAYILNFEHTTLDDLASFHKIVTLTPHLISWWHYLMGTYILIIQEYHPTENANSIVNYLRNHYPDTPMFVAEIQIKNTGGYLPKEAWDWINGQLRLSGGFGMLGGMTGGLGTIG